MKPAAKRFTHLAEPLTGLAAVLLIWEWVSRHVGNAVLVPPPAVVWRAFVGMLDSDLPMDIAASLFHLGIGYGLGACAGQGLALLAASSQWEIGSPNWPATPDAQKAWIDTVLWKHRGWSWITEGDAHAGGAVDDQGDLPGEPRRGRCKSGVRGDWSVYRQRRVDDMKGDIRGKPVWEAAKWNLNSAT